MRLIATRPSGEDFTVRTVRAGWHQRSEAKQAVRVARKELGDCPPLKIKWFLETAGATRANGFCHPMRPTEIWLRADLPVEEVARTARHECHHAWTRSQGRPSSEVAAETFAVTAARAR
jgi:hypothetical protein